MPHSANALIEHPPAQSHWTLQRETGDEWCSLACTPDGWTLSIHGGEFTVLAEGGRHGHPDAHDVDALRSRLRAQGWNETPGVTIRLKPDRRRRP
jgi:hypothetical protein